MMVERALRQAWESHSQAEAALVRLQKARHLAEAERSWRDFVGPFGTAFNKLAAWAAADRRFADWYGPYRKIRNEDPLLAFLRAARNADEHSFVEIAEQVTGSFQISGDMVLSGTFDHRGFRGTAKQIGPKPVTVNDSPARLELVPIVSKKEDKTYGVPAQHLGEPIVDVTPLAVGRLGLAFLKDVLSKAGAHAT